MQLSPVQDGFREGSSAGHEASLQEGFDRGFRRGVATGMQWARMEGKIRCSLSQSAVHSHVCSTLAAAAHMPPTHTARMHQHTHTRTLTPPFITVHTHMHMPPPPPPHFPEPCSPQAWRSLS